ncbi:MAG TPA: Fe-S cluster assembly protein SufD [Candidatus Limnocylindrales bacterium]|nr:Fe-S cluster assembly protein SufD [Candidatus Limnocylindrales bacterium]
MITATQAPERYLEAFEQFSIRSATAHAWLKSLRQEGFARFAETGFPTTHDEDWRFTSITPIAQTDFKAAAKVSVDPSDLEAFGGAGFVCRLVFVNGRFARELSQLPALPGGVAITGLAEAISANPKGVEQHLGQYLNCQRDSFAALNTAFMEDGIYVHVPRGTILAQPVYVLYISVPGDVPAVEHPRNLIVVEENSQATIVEDYVTLQNGGAASSFSNAATELVAAPNAVVSHYMIVRQSDESYNVSTLRIQQGRSSNVSTHSLLLSSALARNNVHPVLAGEGAECLINGLFMANGREHMDNYMLVEHAAPHCNSRQFYNGILNGHGHGVFHGRIIVHKDAQKTDAKQTNRNLLLSDEAQIDTKPQLEIYADDVKCTHGATIGQVEENALFYLRSRGLDENAARHLLLLAFANECLERMTSQALRKHLERLVMEWLPEAARYAGAKPAAAERTWEEAG